MNKRESFGQYLETAGPGKNAENARRRFGDVSSLASLWRGRLTSRHSRREDTIGALGPPDQESTACISYDLGTRPGYLYTFVFAPDGGLAEGKFIRRDPMEISLAMPVNEEEFDEFRRLLSRLGITKDELRHYCGDPVEEVGWWPVETWEYTNGLVIEMRHGVVE